MRTMLIKKTALAIMFVTQLFVLGCLFSDRINLDKNLVMSQGVMIIILVLSLWDKK